jgi:DNA-directed RNA polymerase subunit RPC12/RpoP
VGIYDGNEDMRYLSVYCQKCNFKGQIISGVCTWGGVICPSCGNPIEQVTALDANSCQDEL